ncbi:MAG: hypothetical protein WD270_02405 [Acetobacterales bacterium]
MKMGWAHSIHIPLGANPDAVETIHELRRLTCFGRCFAEVAGGDITVHFETLEDSASFMDMFICLLNGLADLDDLGEAIEQERLQGAGPGAQRWAALFSSPRFTL